MILGGSVDGAAHDGAPVVEMDVVLPGHTDATGDLDAVVDDVERVGAHVGLGHTGQGGDIAGAGVDGDGERVGHRFRALESHVHVGDAVLERLVGHDRSTEGDPLPPVLDGDLQRSLGDADELGALQGDRQVPLRRDLLGSAPDLSDDGRPGKASIVESHRGESPRHVEAAPGSHLYAGRVGRHEDLGEAVVARCGDEKVSGAGRGLDVGLRSVEHDVVAGEDGGGGDVVRLPPAVGLAERPRRHVVAGEQPRQDR